MRRHAQRSSLRVVAGWHSAHGLRGQDGEWIAFDAARPGASPTVFVARLRRHEAIPQDDWRVIDRSASHPFWSADGSILYDLRTTPSSDLRNVVRAHRFDGSPGVTLGEPFTAFTSAEMVVPATSPVSRRLRRATRSSSCSVTSAAT
jgi:hypothetical protein